MVTGPQTVFESAVRKLIAPLCEAKLRPLAIDIEPPSKVPLSPALTTIRPPAPHCQHRQPN